MFKKTCIKSTMRNEEGQTFLQFYIGQPLETVNNINPVLLNVYSPYLQSPRDLREFTDIPLAVLSGIQYSRDIDEVRHVCNFNQFDYGLISSRIEVFFPN